MNIGKGFEITVKLKYHCPPEVNVQKYLDKGEKQEHASFIARKKRTPYSLVELGRVLATDPGEGRLGQ